MHRSQTNFWKPLHKVFSVLTPVIFVLEIILGVFAPIQLPFEQSKPEARAADGDSWYDLGWSKRKAITIVSNTSTILTNFQVRIPITYDSDMQADFDDIRFTSSTGTTLVDHWLETKTNSSAATYWVEVPSLPASGTTTVYMYYGNASVASSSSATTTFAVADEFEDGTVNTTTLWTMLSGNGAYTETTGTLHFVCDALVDCNWWSTGRPNKVLVMNTSTVPLPSGNFHAQVKLDSSAVNYKNHFGIAVYASELNAYLWGRFQEGSDNFSAQKLGAGVSAASSTTVLPAYVAIRKIGDYFSFYHSTDNIVWSKVGSDYNDVNFSSIALFGKNWQNEYNGVDFTMDNFYIRNYEVDPTVSTGSEENPVLYFSVTGSATQTAGTAQTVTLTLKEVSSGSTLTSYTGVHSLIFSGPAAAASGDNPTASGTEIGSTTTLTFTSGVATTSLILYKAQSTSLDVYDATSTSYTSASSTAYDLDVTVSPGAFAGIGIDDTVTTATSGVAFSLTHGVFDTWENAATSTIVTTTVTVNAGSIAPTSIPASAYYATGEVATNTIISGITEVQNAIITFTNGAVTNTITFSVTGTPAVPTGVSATRSSDTAFTIAWTNPSIVESGVLVERSVDSGSYTTVTTTAANATSTVDTGTLADHTYQWRVSAFNSVGTSTTATDGIVHYTTPSAPTAVTSTWVSDSQFTITFTTSSAITNTSTIERCSGSGCDSNTFTVITGSPTSSASITDTGTAANNRYKWRVAAAPGSPEFVTSTYITSSYNYTSPSAPASTTATVVSASEIGLTWTDNAAYETGYGVERRTNTGGGFGSYAHIATTSANATSSQDTDITAGTRYQYRVRALSTNAHSDYDVSNVPNSAPEIQSVTAVENSDGTVTVNYQARSVDTSGDVGSVNQLTPSFQYCATGSSCQTITALTAGATSSQSINSDGVTWASITTTWTPTRDYPNVHDATAKVKVTVNDLQSASNSTASATSSAFVLDTLPPQSPSILVDASSTPALLTLSATETSTLYMRTALSTSALDSASYSLFTSTTTISLSSDPSTIYAQFRDAYNNTSTVVSVVTPATPANTMIQDASNVSVSPAEYRLFVAWKVVSAPSQGSFGAYKLYRSTNQTTWSLISTITDRTTNYYLDQTAPSGTAQYYKVVSTDSLGDVSFGSTQVNGTANGTQDSDEGSGGTQNAPVITSVATSTVTPSAVTVTWNTDTLSTSTVSYSTTAGVFTSSVTVNTMADNNSSIGAHQVVVTGLGASTTYYFKVMSADVNGTTSTDSNGGQGYVFTTLAGPTVTTSPSAVTKGNTSAVVSWGTSAVANSAVFYSTTSNFASTLSTTSASYVTSHSLTLTSLTQDTKYFYYIRSTNSAGSAVYDRNVVNGVIQYYVFTTANDSTAPVISAISSLVNDTGAYINWTTDEAANSQVSYGTTLSYGSTATGSAYETTHSLSLSSLSAGTKYYYKIISTDAAGNQVTDDNSGAGYSFTTASYTTVVSGGGGGGGSSVDTTPPIITALKVSEIGRTGATITWTTNEQGISLVRYGTSRSYDLLAGDENTRSTKHKVILKKLDAGTTYHFKAESFDASGNFTATENAIFATLGSDGAVVAPNVEENDDEIPTATLALENFISDKVKTGSTALLQKVLLSLSANPLLRNVPEDAIAQTVADITERVINAPAIVGTRPEVEVRGSDATIRWTTDKKTSGLASYAKESDYQPGTSNPYTTTVIENGVKSKLHTIKLTNLETATQYHFQVTSKGEIGGETKSKDITFNTASVLPKIEKAKIVSAKASAVDLSWLTNIPTASTLEYTNLTTKKTLTIGDSTFLVNHTFTIPNLDSGISYAVVVKARNEAKDEASSAPLYFSTTIDKEAPKVSNLSANSTLYPGKESKVQTIISWNTDKSATAQVFYQEGVAKTGKVISAPIDTAHSKKHITVLTTLKPGTVYKYWVESRDTSGNLVKSDAFTMLTPIEKETVVEIIGKNFQSVFGWTKQVKLN